MNTPPTLPYNGITIVQDVPSRFDKQFNRLASGPVKTWLEQEVLGPINISLAACDLRDLESVQSFLPETTRVILAGQAACAAFNCLSDPPGYIGLAKGIPAVPVFNLQECCDHRSFTTDEDDDNSPASDSATKDSIPTLFQNRRFWTALHIRKFLTTTPPAYPRFDPYFYPSIESQIKLLDSIKDQDIFLDIETSRLHRNISCIGWTSTSLFPKIYVVPVYLYNGILAYKEFHRWHRAFSLALSRNNIVVHNANFDIPILHAYFKFCLPSSIYDTMLAQHRIFLEAEKSLGHTISCWTSLPYHKNTNTEAFSAQSQQELWTYNAKDVYALPLIKNAQLSYAATIPGLLPSIAQANASFLPYLHTSLTGLILDTTSLALTQQRLKRHQNIYARIAAILSGIPNFNPGSRLQCAKFFHDTLHYPVQSRTDKGQPALGSKQLYSLLAKYNNPLLNVTIKYREVAKDASMLESTLWEMP